MTHPDFPDLTGLNPEVTLVPIAELVPFHRRTDAGLRVKRLKEPSHQLCRAGSSIHVRGYAPTPSINSDPQPREKAEEYNGGVAPRKRNT